MKIVFLNVWEGELLDAVTEFIREQSLDTDVFCFQEFSDKMSVATKDILFGYEKHSASKPEEGTVPFQLTTFVRKDIERVSSGILLKNLVGGGVAIYVQIQIGNNSVYVCNVHGISKPSEKSDTPIRLKQSKELIDFFEEKEGAVIIGGDFNLFSDTKSVQMFEENGYKDFIKDFSIKTTRNHYAWDIYPIPYYHSDYVFMKSDFLKIKNFSVLDNEISDHLPLILEVE